MSRRLLIAAAAIAAAGFVTASALASARYVVSGKTEFGNARMVHLTVHDGAVYRMYLRSVSSGKRRDSGGRKAAAVAWGRPREPISQT